MPNIDAWRSCIISKKVVCSIFYVVLYVLTLSPQESFNQGETGFCVEKSLFTQRSTAAGIWLNDDGLVECCNHNDSMGVTRLGLTYDSPI